MHALGDRADDDLARAAADVDDADVPRNRMAERLRRADERKAPLLVLGEDLDLDPGDALDLLHGLFAVLGFANGRGRDGADRLGAELLSEPDLGAHDLCGLGDLLVRDAAVALRVGADLRVGALLHHLAELALLRLGDEHARRVRADVDGRAEHRLGAA